MRERCKRNSKKSKIQPEAPPSDFVSLGFNFGQPSRIQNTPDYVVLEQHQQQHHNSAQLLAMLQQSGKSGGVEPVVLGVEEFGRFFVNVSSCLYIIISNSPFPYSILDGSHLLSNSTCSPSSASQDTPPQAALLYNSRNFDSIFLPPSASSSSSLGGQYMLVPEYSAQQQDQPHNTADSNQQPAALPPGTSMCVCGCGELAIAPSVYSAHHHIAMPASDLATAAEDNHQKPSSLFPHSEPSLLESSGSSSGKRPCSILNEAGGRKKSRSNGLEEENHHIPETSSSHSAFPPYFTYPTNKPDHVAEERPDNSGSDETSIASLIAQLTSSRYALIEPEQQEDVRATSSGGCSTGDLLKEFGDHEVIKSSHFVTKMVASKENSAGRATINS